MKKRSGNTRVGKDHNRYKHGMTATPTYKSWSCMKARCFNKANSDYPKWGGRGITVSEKWMSFEGFLEDTGVKPQGMTLERIDVNGNYCKENCTWATRTEQSRNRNFTKLTMDKAEAIRRMRESGATYMKIADTFGISISQAHRVSNNESWVSGT